MKKGPPKAEQRRGSEQRPSRGLWRFRLATSKFPKTPPRRKVQSPDKSEVEDEKDQNIVCICLTFLHCIIFIIAKDENLDKGEDIVTPLNVVGKPGWKAPTYQSFCLNVQEEGPGKYQRTRIGIWKI